MSLDLPPVQLTVMLDRVLSDHMKQLAREKGIYLSQAFNTAVQLAVVLVDEKEQGGQVIVDNGEWESEVSVFEKIRKTPSATPGLYATKLTFNMDVVLYDRLNSLAKEKNITVTQAFNTAVDLALALADQKDQGAKVFVKRGNTRAEVRIF